MSLIVGCDPGKHGNGLSIFVDGLLGHAQYTGGLGGQIDCLLEPEEPTTAILEELRVGVGMVDTLIIEVPQIYDQQKQVGDQEDLLDLAIIVGAVIRGARSCVKSVLRVKPARWKGQVPKDVMVERIKSKLSPAELACVDLPTAKGLHHNVWDGVGLGLYRLGRLGK